MIEKHSLTITGTSGKSYNLAVFPIDRKFEERGAVYVVTICKAEENEEFSFNNSPVFLGETDRLAGHFDNHPKAECFRLAAQALGATAENIAVGSILEDDPKKRQAIKKDLEARFKWVCNKWTP